VPGFDGIVCLPGTHSKWAHISAGEVVSFQTFLTGEMFALLAGHSVGASGWDDAAFAEAVADAITSPARVSARLFGLRAEALLADLAPETARARLSGLLIGAELAAARPYWLGQRVVIVAADGIAHAYAAALAAQGVQAELLPADQMTLAGLTLAQAGETP
jgi:2-dehydro-3-deoxygalactonokinase